MNRLRNPFGQKNKKNQIDPGKQNQDGHNLNTQNSLVLDHNIQIARKNAAMNSGQIQKQNINKQQIQDNNQNIKLPNGFNQPLQHNTSIQDQTIASDNYNNNSYHSSPDQLQKQFMKTNDSQDQLSANYTTVQSSQRSGGQQQQSDIAKQIAEAQKNIMQTTKSANAVNGELDEDLEGDFMNEDFLKRIFKPREIKFKSIDPNDKNCDFLDPDFLLQDDMERFEDRDGRTVMHRASLEQRIEVIRQTLDNIKNSNNINTERYINREDKYGNTPLLLSCVYDYQERIPNQKEVVSTLIAQGAYVDAQNPNSLFTTLHWACVHGRKDIVAILLQKDAKVYIPDKHGYFPIDYAGKFKHVECVQLLIQHTLEQVLKYRNMTEPQMSLFVNLNGKAGPQCNSHVNQLLLFSPILHTSTLYWACMYDSIPDAKIDEIISQLEAYAELPVLSDKWRTPCHAAAQAGSHDKLRKLLKNIKERHGDRTKAYRKDIINNFKPRYYTILRQKRYKILKKFYFVVFERKLYEYGQMANFKYDFQDKLLNTPLHIASQYGNHSCVQILVEDYLLSLTVRNSLGWMPKDLQQHDNVSKQFEKYYRKKDTIKKQKEENKLKLQKAELARQNQIYIANQGIIAQFQQQQISPLQSPTRRKQGNNSLNESSNEPYKLQLEEPTVSMFQQDLIEDEMEKKHLLSTKEKLERELITCRNHMPHIPPLVLKVSVAKQNSKAIINGMIVVLQNQDFTVQMLPSLENDRYYIALKLKQSRLEQEAKLMKLKIKLCDVEAKQVFEPNQKIKFEPFRTKDQQKIIISLIKNILSPDSLIEQKILIQILPMHDFYGIHEIRDKWEQSSKIWPQPIPIIQQFYKDGFKYQYTELSSIKNYFGEKTGFYFAWMAFYTSWLLIPAFLGLILTIYQIMSTVDNIFTSLYSLLVCIWVTIFIEQWRRKSSEIALRWGVLQDSAEFTREVRSEFNGDEYFSNISHKVNKLDVHSRFYLIQILSIPIFIILIGACVGVYFATRTFKNDFLNGEENHDRIVQILAGVINGVSIAIVNFIYQQLSTIFMKIENHKYEDSYEKSFIFKLFAFKFINTNISLFYTAFIDQNFNSLYYLIVGMALQKGVQIFALKILKKYIFFWYKRRQYFKKIRAKAKEQALKHYNFKQELDQETRDRLEEEIQKWQKKPIFDAIFNGGATPENVYHRLVFNTQGKIGTDFLLTDYIEINSVMMEMVEKEQINEISEVFILFGLAVLYACACPIAAFIVMLHNLVDMKWDLWTQYTCIRRPIAQSRSNIGPWLKLAEFMAITAVISNSLLLYFSSPTLKSWLANTFELESELYLLWIIVGIEHVIILVKIICSITINDMPGWVQKSFSKVQTETDKIMIEEKERDDNEKIHKLKTAYSTLQTKYKTVVRKVNQNKFNQQSELHKKDAKLQRMSKDKEESLRKQQELEKLKGVQIMKQIEDEKNKKKQGNKMGLVDFFDVHESEWHGKERVEKLEKLLSRNLRNRLMNTTFNKLEREILSRRISKLYSTKKTNQINCSQCAQSTATLECLNCLDHFCAKCSNEIHNSTNQILSMHTVVSVPLEGNNPSLMKFSLLGGQNIQQQLDQLTNNQGIPKNLSNKPVWKKFEYFNFTVDPANDLYQYVQRQYVYLRQQYIDANFIEGQDKISYQSLFVDKQYDLLTDTQAKLLQNKHKKLFGDQQLQPQTDRFNEEELLYMNRISYYLFRYKGEQLTFANFAQRLNILQYAQYSRRVTLWLSIMDEQGDEVITREYFEQFLNTLYVQDITQQMSIQSIVDMIFSHNLTQTQSQEQNENNIQKEMTINKLIDSLNQEGIIRQFMECILQYNEMEVKDKI